MADIFQIIKEPLTNEKSALLLEQHNQYTFSVHPKANKNQIKNAVEQLFNVKVLSVKTTTHKGKTKYHARTRTKGKTTTIKKAIVRLPEGEAIDML